MTTLLPDGYALCTATSLVTGSIRKQQITFAFGPFTAATPGVINAKFLLGIRGLGTSPMRQGFMSQHSTFIDAHTLLHQGGALYSFTTSINLAGTSTSDYVPPNVAGILRKHTLFAGPKFRGRCFLPSCTIIETQVDEVGNIGSTLLTSLNTAWAAAYTEWTTGTDAMPLVLLHHDGSGPTPVTSLDVSPLVATLKKRLRK